MIEKDVDKAFWDGLDLSFRIQETISYIFAMNPWLVPVVCNLQMPWQ